MDNKEIIRNVVSNFCDFEKNQSKDAQRYIRDLLSTRLLKKTDKASHDNEDPGNTTLAI